MLGCPDRLPGHSKMSPCCWLGRINHREEDFLICTVYMNIIKMDECLRFLKKDICETIIEGNIEIHFKKVKDQW